MQIFPPVDSRISSMILLAEARCMQPEPQPQPVTRWDGEQLVVTFPKGWRWDLSLPKTTGYSPVDDAKAEFAAYRGFKPCLTLKIGSSHLSVFLTSKSESAIF